MTFYEAFIGISSFICGVLVMYAIHRVVFDMNSAKANEYIRKLKEDKGTHVEVEHIHTYATPDDVLDLKFNDYIED